MTNRSGATPCRIKLCGLRTPDDVRTAARLGVEAVGFVLTESVRRVTESECRRLRPLLPPVVRVHGVFAADDPGEIRRLVETCGLDAAQVHGPEDDPDYWRALEGVPLVRAFRVKGPETLAALEAVRGTAFLLDAYVRGEAGGTGRSFDWELARQARAYGSVILAGGLTPENVAGAIRTASPWMVDVSSGIERAPGEKDPARMEAFVHAVREAAASPGGEG